MVKASNKETPAVTEYKEEGGMSTSAKSAAAIKVTSVTAAAGLGMPIKNRRSICPD